jgi:ABC-2 type transport system permease protein
VLSRPVERTRYLAAYVAFVLAALVAIALLYGLGAYAAWLIVRPDPGSLSGGSLLRASILLALLLWAVAGYSLLCSAYARERGRALGLAIGLTIGLYAWNFLASLVSVLAPFARISPWYWFNPSPVLAGGGFPWWDALVLVAVAVVCCAAAAREFLRRDL